MASKLRSEQLSSAQSQVFDVVVIGGGITGAGIALDAVTRGLSVCLVEQYDFAHGTSSRSTKLIHGGLRYLKQLELGLVRTVGRERRVVYQAAPHLVRPIEMLLPLYKGGSLGAVSTRLALWIYDRLAEVDKAERFRMLQAKEVLSKVPELNPEGLLGGAAYTEYRTDDARLVIANLVSARKSGACCLNYLKVQQLHYDSGQVSGVHCLDLLDNSEIIVRGKKVVAAAGPWADELRTMDESEAKPMIRHSKGVHLVFDASTIPVQQAIYTDVPGDARMIFIVPRGNKVYVGTTDTFYNGDIAQPGLEVADVGYLISALQAIFPTLSISEKDIDYSWSGIRQLLAKPGKAPGELSRKDEVLVTHSGLICIMGGKLTGYRHMAEKVIDKVVDKLGLEASAYKCKTKGMPLEGFISDDAIVPYIHRMYGEAKQVGFQLEDIQQLVYTYGTSVEKIIEHAYDLYADYSDVSERLLMAELRYGLGEEMVQNVSDFLIRRTGMLYFNRSKAMAIYRKVAAMIGQHLNQSVATVEEGIAFFEAAAAQTVDIS